MYFLFFLLPSRLPRLNWQLSSRWRSWIDKAVFTASSPVTLLKRYHPLPTKIHLCSHTYLKIHHLDACIETMTIMTAWDGSQSNTNARCSKPATFVQKDWFWKMKTSADFSLFFFLQKMFKFVLSTYLYRRSCMNVAPIVLQDWRN